MDDDMKQKVKIGVSVGCLLIAAVILYFTMSDPSTGGSGGNREVYLICANPKCEMITTMSADDFREHMMANSNEMGPMGMMMPGQGPTVVCPECGELSCYIGEKCEECGEIYVVDYTLGSDAMKCPNCGYDKYENRKSK